MILTVMNRSRVLRRKSRRWGLLGQLKYAIGYFKELKKKPGEEKTRYALTQWGTTFDRIVASKVVVANETLYLNRKDGFAGYGLKKDEAVEKCSNLDDVIVIGKDGVMKVMKIADKMFVGKAPLRVAVFRRDDQKVYNMVYRDGKTGRLTQEIQVGALRGTRSTHFSRPTPDRGSSSSRCMTLKKRTAGCSCIWILNSSESSRWLSSSIFPGWSCRGVR